MEKSALDIFSNHTLWLFIIVFILLSAIEFFWLPKTNDKDTPYVRLGSPENLDFKDIEPLLKKFNINKIYLVHGTFAGIDPLGMGHRKILGALSFYLGRLIRILVKGRGFFDSSLISGLSQLATTEVLDWGGENNHIGRLKGAFKFLENLSPTPGFQMILAHSHGAQILALTQHLRLQTDLGKKLLSFAKPLGFQEEKLREKIASISSQPIHWITLGSMLRVPFPLGNLDHLAHFHNCRTLKRTGLFGILTARPGDMIQTWAVEGSDFFPSTPKDLRLYRDLDQLLGKGIAPLHWAQKIASGTRLNPEGINFVADYKDSNIPVLGPLLSLWGHGVYLSKRSVAFQIYSYLSWLESKSLNQRV